jgi:hypothetical protein
MMWTHGLSLEETQPGRAEPHEGQEGALLGDATPNVTKSGSLSRAYCRRDERSV